jgi:transposase InsO family protein
VDKIMAQEKLAGMPTRRHRKNLVSAATFEDLVQRNFTCDVPNQLWVTDITEHPTREGKVYCCAVFDAHSSKVVGWSLETHQALPVVTNSRSMALTNRTPTTDTALYSDYGTHFTSGMFKERVRQAGLVPPMGTIGGHHRRRLRQHGDRVILGPSPDGAAQPEKVANQERIVIRPLRIPRHRPQPPPTAQLAWDAHTSRL